MENLSAIVPRKAVAKNHLFEIGLEILSAITLVFLTILSKRKRNCKNQNIGRSATLLQAL